MRESAGLDLSQCLGARGGGNRTAGERIATTDDSVARDVHQLNGLGFPGLKSDGGARRDVETLPVGLDRGQNGETDWSR